MKKTIILILLIIVILIILIKFQKRTISISKIKYFSYSYSTGNMIDSNVRYEIDLENGKYIAKIKPNNVPIEETKKIEINNDVLEKIKIILEKYEVNDWNGFDKNDKNILDGNSFSLNIVLTNNERISAHGYMKWPKNYSKVRGELDSLFMDIYDS